MIDSKKSAKWLRNRAEILEVACKLDDLPDDPNAWTPEQRRDASALILRLGAPESFLRRFARGDLS
jgi:hypothetical protein